jgi:uncharacterized membrane protein YcaP (DUF421 family)
MYEFFEHLLGLGEKDLTAGQMSVRAIIIFFVALALIRLTGMRSFGKSTAFDVIISITLGAVLSRAITGEVPFFPTLIAAVVLAIIHKTIALVTARSHSIGKILKGNPRLIVKNGVIIWKNMRYGDLSETDLMEGIRKNINVDKLEDVKEAYFDRDGAISAVKKEEE